MSRSTSAIARRAAETVEPGPSDSTSSPTSVPLQTPPVALQRVLTTLLDNALRHARTRVELRVCRIPFDVSDDGPGFAAEDLPHMFEPLFRGDRARGGDGGVSGWRSPGGPSEGHGGEVKAANPPEGGARVTVTLG